MGTQGQKHMGEGHGKKEAVWSYTATNQQIPGTPPAVKRGKEGRIVVISYNGPRKLIQFIKLVQVHYWPSCNMQNYKVYKMKQEKAFMVLTEGSKAFSNETEKTMKPCRKIKFKHLLFKRYFMKIKWDMTDMPAISVL
jgi:hypothetical protein